MSALPKSRAGGRRSAARLGAVQALYQIDMAKGSPELTIAEFIDHRLGKEIEGEQYNDADANWFADVVRGVSTRSEEIDVALNDVLVEEHNKIDRLTPMLRSVLRAGAYEILIRVDVPPRVVISEYMDVARAFFGGTEPGLVNGVLDHIARLRRADELAAPTGDDGR